MYNGLRGNPGKTKGRVLFYCVYGAAFCAAPTTGLAQTSFPMLNSLYPAGLQRGQSVEVTLSGLHDYHGSYRVLIQGVGVVGEVVPPAGGWPSADPKSGATPILNEVKLKLTAAPDAPFGVRELRVATPRGVSTVGQIIVGDEPESQEKEPNNDLTAAQEIAVPSTVNGRIQQGEDIDVFRFNAKAGETVTFSVICARLQDKTHDLQTHADPLITLRDAAGRELAASDDYYRQDPLLSHKFERDGEYQIEIRDVNYQGNPHWVYRLNATKRPFVTAVMPMALRPGDLLDLKPVGFGLTSPAARAELPASPPTGWTELALVTAAGTTNPVPLTMTDLPCVVAPETISASAPMSVNAPVAVSARLRKPGDIHRFKLAAKAGQMYSLEVAARRLYSRIDSVLAILNPQGQEIAANDDSEGMDSRLDWQAPADGEYQIEVRDQHGGGGDTHVYLLTVRLAGPDFTLKCDDDKMRLGPGNSGAWYIHVQRKFGFNSEIKVEARGLPPGVTAAPLVIPPNVSQGCLILTSAPDAKVGVGEVNVVGTATVKGADGKEVTLERRAQPVTEVYIPGGGRGLYPVDTQAVAVASQHDILLEASPSDITLAPGGTVRVDVKVIRAPHFKKAVNLDIYLRHLGSVYGNPLPPGVTLDEGASKTLLNETETQGHLVLKADASAQPVTRLPIALLGSISVNFVVKVSYSAPPVFLTVKKP